MDSGAPRDPAEVEDQLWDGVGGKLAFDIGANQGQSVEKLAMRFERVVAVEPCAESYEVLARVWDSYRVICKQAAVADRPGTVELAIRAAPIMSGQLVAPGMPYHGEDLGPATAAWGADLGTRVVAAVTLDELAGTYGIPDFVKIDTEGGEGRVLAGGTGLLRARRTRWLIEFHTAALHDECVRRLEATGHTVETVRHPHYQPGTGMWAAHGWLRASPGGERDDGGN